MDLPVHLASLKPDLDPYGQLLRMLVPRALGIAFYDARGRLLWAAEGYDGPDPAPLVAAALAAGAAGDDRAHRRLQRGP